MDIEIIGNRIAELRKARGLTQTELARRLKVSYQAVSTERICLTSGL